MHFGRGSLNDLFKSFFSISGENIHEAKGGGGSQIKTSDKRSPPTRKALSAYGTQGGNAYRREEEKRIHSPRKTLFSQRGRATRRNVVEFVAPHSRRRRRLALDACPNPFLLPPPPVASHAYNVWRGGKGGCDKSLKGSGRKREGVASQVTSIPHSLASKNVSKQVAEEEAPLRHVHGV